jgi:hypothetical protein
MFPLGMAEVVGFDFYLIDSQPHTRFERSAAFLPFAYIVDPTRGERYRLPPLHFPSLLLS